MSFNVTTCNATFTHVNVAYSYALRINKLFSVYRTRGSYLLRLTT